MGRSLKKHRKLKAVDPYAKNCKWGVEKPDPTGRRHLAPQKNEDKQIPAKVRAIMRAQKSMRDAQKKREAEAQKKKAEKTNAKKQTKKDAEAEKALKKEGKATLQAAYLSIKDEEFLKRKKEKAQKRNELKKEKQLKKKKEAEEIDEEIMGLYEEIQFGEVADRPPELKVVPKKKQVISWATPVPQTTPVAPVVQETPTNNTYASEYKAIADQIRQRKKEARRTRRAELDKLRT